jgi:hypothetical protein
MVCVRVTGTLTTVVGPYTVATVDVTETGDDVPGGEAGCDSVIGPVYPSVAAIVTGSIVLTLRGIDSFDVVV